MKFNRLLAGLVLLVALPVMAAEKVKAPPEMEQALTARISELYTYFQQGKFRQAEALVEEESKDSYFNTAKTRIMDHEIETLSFEPDLEHATALVTCRMLAPGFNTSSPLKIPLTSRWRLIDGQWYLYMRKRPVEEGDGVRTPFGQMHFDPNATPGAGKSPGQTFQTPSLDTLARLFEVEKKVLDFPVKSDGPVTRSVEVASTGEARLNIVSLNRDVRGVEVHWKETLEPGERGEITFTYDPKAAVVEGDYNYRFRVEPIMQGFTVRLRFTSSGQAGPGPRTATPPLEPAARKEGSSAPSETVQAPIQP